MNHISVDISGEIYSRLKEIAREEGCSPEECLTTALTEYIVSRQDNYLTDMNAVNRVERAFFLSAGE